MAEKDFTAAASRVRTRRARLGILAIVVAAIGVSLAIRARLGDNEANAVGPQDRAGEGSPPRGAAAAQESPVDPVAVINGEEIGRNDLAAQCIRFFGEEVLENLVNKQIILQHCKAQNVSVKKSEVEAEIARMAERFGITVERWMTMLEEERGIAPVQYASDIIWPTLALRKLAADKLEPTPVELQKAYEAKYGPSVRVRMIDCLDLDKARRAHREAINDPDQFGALARKYSDDPNSGSANGLVQPIRMHVGDPALEQAAFALQPGEISNVVTVGDHHVVLLCEEQIPDRGIALEEVTDELTAEIRERKERQAATELFEALQAEAKVENVFNDSERSRQMPGVAAVVNGRKITMRELGEACIERHGENVLDGLITRRIVKQEVVRQGIEISEADLDAEIERAAASALAGETPEGEQPDVDKWLKLVTEEQGISLAVYVDEVVWPSVAMKRLAGETVDVTDDDLRKSYEANYGPRVECLAVVLNNQRRAQEVWELARDKSTSEFFGDLAEQYSVESQSRTLRGRVPPIQRHGGQPLLEKEAFALKSGEMSGVIQVGEKFIILHCLGFTEPQNIEFAEVRDMLYEDLHEKKLRVAMANMLDDLREQAQIDNFLAGTVQTPKRLSARPAQKPPAAEETPPATTAPRRRR